MIMNLPNEKQLKLLIEIHKKNFITANFRCDFYYNYSSLFKALENLKNKGWLIKDKNQINENVYYLSNLGINLLVIIGYLPNLEFIIY